MSANLVASPRRAGDDARIMGMAPRRWHAQRALAGFFVLAPLAFVLAVSFAVTPEDIESGRVVLSPPCLFKLAVGRPCPSCGLTRAFAALSHGELELASSYNRAGLAVYALFWLTALAAAFHGLRSTFVYMRLGRSQENS
jgi:hypothetical protein